MKLWPFATNIAPIWIILQKHLKVIKHVRDMKCCMVPEQLAIYIDATAE